MRDWHDPSYLQTGTPRQRAAHTALQQLGILGTLSAYGPVLAGTLPLAVDVPDSDLDLICQARAEEQPALAQLLRRHYGSLPGFELRQTHWQEQPTLVSRFRAAGFAWEIFAQPLPAQRQQAVRHLLVEYAVLQAGGETWRRAVQQLKQQGLKTEPAFAHLLGLPGDPYAALLALEEWSAEALRAYVAGRRLP